MSRYEALKDDAREQQLIRIRLALAAVIVVALLILLLSRFFFLQIHQYKNYHTQSQSNRVHLQRVAPKRGLILDREFRLLAENKPSYTLTLVRDRIEDMPALEQQLKQLDMVSDADIERFRKRAYRYRAFEGVPIKFNLSDTDIAVISANRIRLDGVEIKADLARHYPYEKNIAHMLGYVGRINEKELAAIDNDNYGATYRIGKIGIEKEYESTLHGQVGREYVETDARGRVKRILERQPPVPGENLILHLDLDVQKKAFEALGENRGGNKNATGRDHHPFCFSMLMAGGGFKGGHIYGKTDEIGWNVVEKPVHPNDLHATMLHCFGLDHEQLTYRFQGRDFRLTDVAGNVIKDWLA